MKVRIKKLNEKAVIPTYAKKGDAGMDLTAVSKYHDEDGNVVYGTGLAFEIPEGHMGLVVPRSSISRKNLSLTNSVGIIDSGYRGEVTAKFKSFELDTDEYEVGDRIAQIIILPFYYTEFVEADELTETERGAGGYGSTGR